MTVNEIVASNVLNKSKLPDADYVINPYIGCAHACIYCYARFMKRFTGHNEKWGTFVDVKTNSATLINDRSKKIRNKCVFMSSVTDPYQPIERKYNITRAILQRIITLEPQLSI